ncbi:acetylornithine aminotransferase [Sorochytrium milnesiophthora]
MLARGCLGRTCRLLHDAPSRRYSSHTAKANVKSSLLPLYAPPTDIVLSSGRGAYLFAEDGRRFLDFTAGIAVCSLGHADEQVAEVIADQAKKLLHTSNLFRNSWGERLARELVESTHRQYLTDTPFLLQPSTDAATRTPSNLSHVFLCNSGTEANEAAIKFARAHYATPGKHKLLTFSNAFHGRSMGALSATPNEKYQAPFQPLVPGFSHVAYNDLAAAESMVDNDFCAIMVEPIQGEGGIHSATPDFLLGLRELSKKMDCLLIFDEIQCGLSRTGRKWAHHWYDIEPDILTAAKPLGNGIPIGAVLTSSAVTPTQHPASHGTTFGGNPFAARVASHVLGRLTSKELLEHVAELSELFRARLAEINSTTPLVAAVRGSGMMWGIEMQSSVDGKRVVELCREAGLLICTAGKDGRVLRLVPPLNLAASEAREGLDILEMTLERMVEEVVKNMSRQRPGQSQPFSRLLHDRVYDSRLQSLVQARVAARGLQHLSLSRFRTFHPGLRGSGSISSLSIDPLLSAGTSGKIALWDLEGDNTARVDKLVLEPLATIPKQRAHAYTVTGLQWYPFDNGMFLSSSYDCTVKVWDTNTLQSVADFGTSAKIFSMDMSHVAAHCLVAVASDDPVVVLCDLQSGGKTHSLIGHRREVCCVKWSPVYEYQVATGGADGTAKLWDIRKAKAPLQDIAVVGQPDGSTVNTSKRQRLDSASSPARRQQQQALGESNRVIGVAFTPDSTMLITLVQRRRMDVWDLLRNGVRMPVEFDCSELRYQAKRGMCPVVLPQAHPASLDYPPAVVVPAGRQALVYDFYTGTVLRRLSGLVGQCQAVVWRPLTTRGTEELYTSTDEAELLCWEAQGAGRPGDLDSSSQKRIKRLLEDAWSSDEEEL